MSAPTLPPETHAATVDFAAVERCALALRVVLAYAPGRNEAFSALATTVIGYAAEQLRPTSPARIQLGTRAVLRQLVTRLEQILETNTPDEALAVIEAIDRDSRFRFDHRGAPIT